MRVLVYGYGSMGRRHVSNALALGHDIAIYDIEWRKIGRPTMLERQHCFDSVAAAVLTYEPEAVVIATPAVAHSSIAQELLDAYYGGPLFVEKPLALSVADAEIFRVFSHPTLMVGYNWRFHPLMLELQRKYLAAGKPALQRATFWMICDRTTWPGTAYADTLSECSHEIDLAMQWLGTGRVDVAASLKGSAWVLTLTHESGALATVVLDDHNSASVLRGCRIECDGYGGGYDVPHHAVDELSAEALEFSYRMELAQFLEAAAVSMPTACPFVDGLAVLEICDAARRSAQCGTKLLTG